MTKTLDDIGPDFEFKLYQDDHPILLQGTEEVDDHFFKNHGEFLNNMFLFMRENGGIGLAGPQIGLPYKFFIMHAPGDKPRVCINPFINSFTEEQIALKEGCLSYPGLNLTLRRPIGIYASYVDMNGDYQQDILHGWESRVFQHEYDHVKGVVFTSHASSTKLKLAKSKVKKNLKKIRRK